MYLDANLFSIDTAILHSVLLSIVKLWLVVNGGNQALQSMLM